MLQLKNQSNPNSCIRVDDFDDNNDDEGLNRSPNVCLLTTLMVCFVILMMCLNKARTHTKYKYIHILMTHYI